MKHGKRCLRAIAGAVSAMVMMTALHFPVHAATNKERFAALVREAWSTHAEDINISSLNMKLDEVKEEYYRLLYTDASWFYVSSSFSYGNTWFGTVGQVTVHYNYEKKDIPAMQERLDAVINAVTSACKPEWTDAEKVLFFHDYLAAFNQYDQTLEKIDAYTALVDGETICQGYSLAMCLLCRAVNIPCYVITSNSLEHMWNMVQVDGKWYQVDVTFDDGLPDKIGRAEHRYLLQSDAAMHADTHHDADDWVFYAPGVTSCDSDAYANAFWKESDDTMTALPDGSWLYTVHNDSSNVKYLEDIKTIVRRTYPDGRTEDIKTLPAYWQVNGKTYMTGFVTTSVYHDRIYFFESKCIKSMTLDGKDIRTEYTLTEEEQKKGNIYGMMTDGEGGIIYQIMPYATYVDGKNTIDVTYNSFQIVEQPDVTTTETTTTTTTTETTTTTTETTTTTTTTETTTTTTTTPEPITTTTETTTTPKPVTTTTETTTTPKPVTTTTETTTTPKPVTTTTETTTTPKPVTTTPETTTTPKPVTTTAATTVQETTKTTVKLHVTAYGDVNNDGVLTVADAVMLCRLVAEDKSVTVTPQGLVNADANNDGTVNGEDVTYILKRLAGLTR